VRLVVVTVAGGEPLLQGWIARYEATRSAVVIGVRSSTLVGAQGDLAQGSADLAFLDQEPALFYRGVLTSTHVADEPIAVVVNPANPLADLPAVVLAELLSGRVADWSAAGGAPGPVQVYLLPDSAGVVQAFTRLVDRPLASQAIVCASANSLQRAVGADPSGIGFLPAPSVSSGVAVLRVDGVLPGEAAYPWQMPLFLLHGPASPVQAREFVGFVQRWER
jgi:ABC-type phosphate transport system substrate-binding protein